jgi:hypothetical protein
MTRPDARIACAWHDAGSIAPPSGLRVYVESHYGDVHEAWFIKARGRPRRGQAMPFNGQWKWMCSQPYPFTVTRWRYKPEYGKKQ